jgi:hypothetical protein
MLLLINVTLMWFLMILGKFKQEEVDDCLRKWIYQRILITIRDVNEGQIVSLIFVF